MPAGPAPGHRPGVSARAVVTVHHFRLNTVSLTRPDDAGGGRTRVIADLVESI